MLIRKVSVGLLVLPIFLSACTFGEGPELSVPGASTTGSVDDNESSLFFHDANAEATIQTISSPVTQNVNDNASSLISNTQNEIDQSTADQSTEVQPDNNSIAVMPQSNNVIDLSQPNLVRIPATDSANAPKIDGALIDYIDGTELLDGEWRFAAQSNARNERLAIANKMFGEQKSDLGSGQHHWAVLHDGVYLYLLVISDDAMEHYQDSNEERKPWKDDSIEIFIDGNNSRLENYDGVDDFHITINLKAAGQIANSSFIETPLIRQSDSSAIIPSDFTFSTGLANGPKATGERGT